MKKKLNTVIFDNQHGLFVLSKAQLQIYFVLDALTSSSNVDIIYNDFPKAFNQINHNILSLKLSDIYVCGLL